MTSKLLVHVKDVITRPANQSGGNLANAPLEIFKICLVVRYNTKLKSIYLPPKISAGCGPGLRQ